MSQPSLYSGGGRSAAPACQGFRPSSDPGVYGAATETLATTRGCRTKPSAKSCAAVAAMRLGAGERASAGLSVTNRAIKLQLFGTHP